MASSVPDFIFGLYDANRRWPSESSSQSPGSGGWWHRTAQSYLGTIRPLPSAEALLHNAGLGCIYFTHNICIACLEPVGVWYNCRTARCPHNPVTPKGPRLV